MLKNTVLSCQGVLADMTETLLKVDTRNCHYVSFHQTPL